MLIAKALRVLVTTKTLSNTRGFKTHGLTGTMPWVDTSSSYVNPPIHWSAPFCLCSTVVGKQAQPNQCADAAGNRTEQTVTVLPALPISTFWIKTCTPVIEDRPILTVSVNVPSILPGPPLRARASVPSILPMAVVVPPPTQSSTQTNHGHSSVQIVPGTANSVYEPHSRHTLVTKVMRCWQTAAVYCAHNRTFSFDVHGESPLPTILQVVCPPSSYWMLRVVPFHRIDKLCRVEMQQLEDPDQLAHHWPPPSAVHWSFRAWHPGTEQPFLDLVLEFALPEALQHLTPPEGVFLGKEILDPYQ